MTHEQFMKRYKRIQTLWDISFYTMIFVYGSVFGLEIAYLLVHFHMFP